MSETSQPLEPSSSTSRAQSFVIVAVVYVVAFVVARTTARELENYLPSLIWVYAGADVAATVVVFIGSMMWNNTSVYDPYWSVAPMVLAPVIALEGHAPRTQTIVIVALVWLWGARLTWNWARGWSGLGHEDFRYVDLRKKMGKAYWIVSFLGLHLMPTVLVYAGCLSIWQALVIDGPRIFAFDVLGFVMTLGAIGLEARADQELRAFRLKNKKRGKILETGVWAHCRHPNYLGEILFWWGLYCFALAANGPDHWVIIGPLAIHALFLFVSIPLMTKRALARRPAYKERIERVPALLPRPWRTITRSDRS